MTNRGAKTIVMVIDDEEAVEELIEAFVEQKGYAHASFNDPVEALHYFKADHEHICFVVMDLTMPRMSGFDLAKEMMGVNPSTPIVLITGQLDPQIPD
jgi:two-component system cell cycle sensor histidine kinase/response regulator CckA